MAAIEGCHFRFGKGTDSSSGAGIVGFGTLQDLQVRRCTFAAGSPAGLFGILVLTIGAAAGTGLDALQVVDCRFANLLAGVFAIGQLGLIRCCGNVITGSVTGLFFGEADLGTTNAFVREAQTAQTGDANAALAEGINAAYRPDLIVDTMQKAAPIMARLSPPATAPTVSAVAQKALVEQFTTSGRSLWARLSTPRAAPTDATAAAAKTEAAVKTSPVLHYAPDVLDSIDRLSLDIITNEPSLTPAVRIDANEISLAAATTPTTSITGTTSGVGISLVFAARGQAGSVIVAGNRVIAPGGNTSACTLMLPPVASVTGNVFAQTVSDGAKGGTAPTLVLICESGLLHVSGNIVHPTEYVSPQRAAGAAIGTWDFLNTTG